MDLFERLSAAGHRIAVQQVATTGKRSAQLELIERLEAARAPRSLMRPATPLAEVAGRSNPDLTIDLTGRSAHGHAPVLTVDFDGQRQLAAGLAAMLAGGMRPRLTARLNGVAVAEALPMLGDRVWLSRAASELLASTVTLIEMCVTRFAAGRLLPMATPTPPAPQRHGQDLIWRYLPHLLAGLGRRALGRLISSRPFYWRTAHRLIEGPGIADTGDISGPPFIELIDDGKRFYADPFVFEWQDRLYLFVEEYPYALGRGIISVAECRPDGSMETPRPVLEAAHHLSYPQVFAHDGEVYMIPESSGGNELVLYRAEHFPHAWVREAVVVQGKKLNDMTLLIRDDRFWLFGTEQRGGGSASDTMVVYAAKALAGPWSPHPMNPILIDRRAARPGGPFIVTPDGRTLLPLQDGTEVYGGGLGIAELTVLSDDDVQFGPVQPVLPGEAWARKGIHTLSRSGRLEVVDSCG
ncbi:hypothetical protein VW23_014725 [Devosia insulae DS-56]|uniref:Glucosamine inositolphosphorylceramide transferase 1 N-terminal domain-containing protein n=1 Tax=Devosia insulae DS-56 TaxID=1116389 RepID=A0A1E5XT27_9HYPH|nr:hypothetical protein [Devosia insulae]OEO31761.1 hypothetical protein VW23_014725 [Devosia insulae DS-56]